MLEAILNVVGNRTLKIFHCPEDSSTTWDEQFDEVSFITLLRDFSNQGPLKNLSFHEVDIKKLEREGFQVERAIIFNEGNIKKADGGQFNSYLIYKKADFGPDFLSGFIHGLNAINGGEIYGYQLLENEKCNLGYIHEKELDSCWAFYGYATRKEMILDIAQHALSNEEILKSPELVDELGTEIVAKLKLKDIAG